MTIEEAAPVIQYMMVAGHSAPEAECAAAYAVARGAQDLDAALSFALAWVLYSDSQLAAGEVYPVEAGHVDWSAYAGEQGA